MMKSGVPGNPSPILSSAPFKAGEDVGCRRIRKD
jgi:hypothetical protein